MIRAQLRTANDSAPLPGMAGTVLDGAATSQNGLLKNVGDEPITSVKAWVENNPAAPLTAAVTVNGVKLPDVQWTPPSPDAIPQQAVQVLQKPLAPGESVAVSIVWSGPAGTVFTGLDDAQVCFGVQ